MEQSSWAELHNEKRKEKECFIQRFFLFLSLSIHFSLYISLTHIDTHTLSLLFLEDVSQRVIVYPVAISARSTIRLLLCEPFCLIGINSIFAGPEICLFGLDLMGSFDVFPAYNHDEVERDTEVTSLKNS